jgi:hypothetical protein
MTDLVRIAAPLIAFVRSRLEALGGAVVQAIDAFTEARMRAALPARLLQAQPKMARIPANGARR